MTINPSDYDVNELRDRPDGIDPFGHDGAARDIGLGGPSGAEEVLESGQYRELFLLQSALGEGALEKPYLKRLPDAYAAEILVFEWLEFLLAKSGFKRTLDVLQYYRSIDWITDGLAEQLREYLTGLEEPTGDAGELTRADHMLSLVYIARIAALD